MEVTKDNTGHLIVSYIITKFDLHKQYHREKSMAKGKVVINKC